MLFSTTIWAVAACGGLALAQTEISLPQTRNDTVTVTIDVTDFCEDYNSINCTYVVLGEGVRTISFFESDGNAIIWGDVNIGPVANILSQQTQGPVNNSILVKRAFTPDPPRRWPNAEVRYQYIDDTSDGLLRELMDQAFANWKQVVPFLNFEEEKDGAGNPIYGAATPGVVSIRSSDAGVCEATIGYYSGFGTTLTMTPESRGTALNIGYCGIKQAVHEIGHTLSFNHEHQRPDRDLPSPGGGITFRCENVVWGCGDPDTITNFAAETGDDTRAYDTQSVMHYPNTAFGRFENGVTLVTLEGAPSVSDIEKRSFPSALDARRVCDLYPDLCNTTGFCGDEITQGTEECDPPGAGNCSRGCRLSCGNGIIDDGEECDDGNTSNNDGCSSTCKLEVCGDGIVQRGEECDDGNVLNGDGCSSACIVEKCGDGIIQGNEKCDDGNTIDGDGCSAACQIELCGDGVIQGDEQCDDGNLLDGDGCSSQCLVENCGDGIIQPYEECDDGNTVNGDGCSSCCKIEKCGDGILQRGEECDDGNLANGDGCSSTCKREHAPPEGCCGDGIVQPGFGEECDDGNLNDGDGCSSSCHLEEKNPCDKCTHRKMCGDGIIQIELGEECDDGNILGGDGCSANCKKETTCPVCEDDKKPHPQIPKKPHDTKKPQDVEHKDPHECHVSGTCKDSPKPQDTKPKDHHDCNTKDCHVTPIDHHPPSDTTVDHAPNSDTVNTAGLIQFTGSASTISLATSFEWLVNGLIIAFIIIN